MRKYGFFLIILVTTLVVGIIYGISVYKFQVFPYRYSKMAYNYFFNQEKIDVNYGPWSIGIYTGLSPFELHDPENISNPVLTGKDVKDIDAKFVADPFMVVEDGRFYMFFEVLNRATSQGDIGYAESDDGRKWEYRKIVIDEPFERVLLLVEI